MAVLEPRRSQHRRAGQPPMSFEWRRCSRHPWLQRSVLVGNSFAPLCFPYDGPAHPVDPDELEEAA